MIPQTQEELLSIVTEKGTVKYSRTETTSEQRIYLTILAEQNNFSAFIEKDQSNTNQGARDKSNEFLVITNNTNNFPPIDVDNLWDAHVKLFSDYVGVTLYGPTIKQSIEEYQLTEQWDIFRKDIERYGLTGYKRRNIVFSEYMVKKIKESSEFQQVVKNKPKLEEIKYIRLSKIGTMVGTFYAEKSCKNADPSCVWITLDAKSAIYQGYRNCGIFAQRSWKEFVSQYTKSKSLIDSKQVRLSMFGELNQAMKCNALIINNSIIKLWNIIADICKEVVSLMEGDEIILKCTDDNYESYLTKICQLLNYDDVKVSCLKMSHHQITINGDIKKFYIKEYIQDKASNQSQIFEVKCIDPEHRLNGYLYAKEYMNNI